MNNFETAFYLGEEKETGYSGVIAEDGLFLAIEVSEGLSPVEGREFLKSVKMEFQMSPPKSLSEIDLLVSDLIKEKNLALGCSLSMGFLKGNVLYLKTVGQGEVVIRRKNKTATLLSGDASASGYYEESDIFIFTTARFIEAIGGHDNLSAIFDHRNPHQIVEEVTPQIQSAGDKGVVSIFLQFNRPEDPMEEQFIKPRGLFLKIGDDIRSYYLRHGKRRTLTFAAVAIIMVVFFWSVVLGYSRRSSAAAAQEVKLAKELVGQKISEAEEVAFLNSSRATSIITEAKDTVEALKKKYPKRKDVDEIESMVAQAENKVFKKEEAVSTEFFDLAVDSEKANGNALYLDGDNLLILDKTAGVLYTLSMDKKSLSKVSSSELKKSSRVAVYEDKKYLMVPGSGIFSIDENGKTKRVIENDKEWGSIADFATYNGNLYLLDSGKDQVYKYVVAESGFGAKTSYFAEGQGTDLSLYSSIAIDSSVYLGGNGSIIKFTAGLRDGFAMNLPNENVRIARIFASKDADRVYGWDKSAGMIYIMAKTGEFEKQIKSAILSKSRDFVVYDGEIYVLMGGKLYKIGNS